MPDAARTFVRDLYQAAVAAVEPGALVRRRLTVDAEGIIRVGDRTWPLTSGSRIFVFGSGKAAVGMGRAAVDILGERLAGGLLVAPQGADLSPIEVVVGEHPVPGLGSVAAAERLLTALAEPEPTDFFLYLLSGGSSALVEKPQPPVQLADLQDLTRALLGRGVPIEAVNTVRKHLSLVKGGRLALQVRAPGAVLVISDVIGDDLATIGSGPFFGDPTTYADARRVLEEAGLWEAAGPAVHWVIERGMAGEIDETPSSCPPGISHHVIGCNRIALEAAAAVCRDHGIDCHILSCRFDGEARELGRFLVAVAREIKATANPFAPPVCLLAGGESTVTVRGSGCGGRNHEVALGALIALEDEAGITVLAAGTDGIDGLADAAGAIADRTAWQRAVALGLDPRRYLAANDSATFFARIDSQLRCGPTGTNVMDFAAVLVEGGSNILEHTAGKEER